MNDIILYKENIGALTKQIEADIHKHWMFQLFIGIEGKLDIIIRGEKIQSLGIVVNINTEHSFFSKDKLHFTLLINPTSDLGKSIKSSFVNNADYYELKETQLNVIKSAINSSNQYFGLMTCIKEQFIVSPLFDYDQRIEELIAEINQCDCLTMEHQVQQLAKKMNLSESRLSHLFKEQTDIPLKSYLLLHQLFSAYHKIFAGISITQAAMEAGFDSPAHLAATSKKMTGMAASKINKDSRFLKVLN